MWNHWVVRACTPHEPFKSFTLARWTWISLCNLYPDMLSAILMPNHLHLILPLDTEKKDLPKLTGLLGAISKKQGISGLWQAIPPASLIPDKYHLRRQLRYVALNPCRKKLCSDPLEWYWSTYREIMGATVQSGVKPFRLAKALGESETGFKVRFHDYVSADPSVNVEGTPFPQSAIPKIWAEKSIGEILAASAAALRVRTSEVNEKGLLRPLFIHLASLHGWHRPSLLAQICGITPRNTQYILNRSQPKSIVAAELCLGDRRLRAEDELLPISQKVK